MSECSFMHRFEKKALETTQGKTWMPRAGVYCKTVIARPIVPDDSKPLFGVRRWVIDMPTARALWDLSEQLTDLQWTKCAGVTA
jgi:hypothetical protein